MAIVADVYSDIGVRVASFLVRCSFLFGIELNTPIVESRCVSMYTMRVFWLFLTLYTEGLH